jgi:importin-4
MSSLRGRSLELFGHVAVAIGKEQFARYFETGMNSAIQALSLDDDDLKEHSYVFFANSSKVMGRAFDPYLEKLVPFLIEAATENELTSAGDEEDEEDKDHDGEDDDDESGCLYLNVHDGFINTKKAALTALGSMAEHTQEGFAPYLQKLMDAIIMEEVGGAMHSYHDIVRAEALDCLSQLVAVACYATGVQQKPAKLQVVVLPDQTAQVIRTTMKAASSSEWALLLSTSSVTPSTTPTHYRRSRSSSRRS